MLNRLSHPGAPIFLLKHLFSNSLINSHSVFKAGNEGPTFILEKRQVIKSLEKQGKKRWGEESVGLPLPRNGFPLLVHGCESLDFIFPVLSISDLYVFIHIYSYFIFSSIRTGTVSLGQYM